MSGNVDRECPTFPADFDQAIQDRSNRKWAENWHEVTGKTDLNVCSTRALIGVAGLNYLGHRITASKMLLALTCCHT